MPGREWADPESDTGLIQGYSERELSAKFEASMQALAESIPWDNIYYIQISDGLRIDPPIKEGHPAYEKGNCKGAMESCISVSAV